MAQEEKVMLEAVDGESSITLVQLYPVLKLNELVSKQMNIYVKNNNKIKKLKNWIYQRLNSGYILVNNI